MAAAANARLGPPPSARAASCLKHPEIERSPRPAASSRSISAKLSARSVRACGLRELTEPGNLQARRPLPAFVRFPSTFSTPRC